MEDIKGLIIFNAQLLWRRRWTALTASWIVCVIGWIGVAMLPDRYTSEARFYVDTMSLLNPLLQGISVNATDPAQNQEIALIQRTLTSRPNLARVAQMTDLDKGVASDAAMQGLIDDLDSRITLSSQGVNLFQLEFTDDSPRVARDVVQALLTIFVERSTGNKREDIQTARSFIEEQIEEYESQLKLAEQRLADFKVKYIDFFSSRAENFAARLQLAKEEIVDAERALEEAKTLRDKLQSQLKATDQFLSVDGGPQIIVGAAPQSLQQRVAAMRARLDELKLQYTDKHPDVIRTQAVLDDLIKQDQEIAASGEPQPGDLTRRMAQVPNEMYSQLGLRLADAEGVVASAERKLDDARRRQEDLERKAIEAPRVEAEFTSLNRDYEVLKRNYESLLQRREAARIAQAADSSTEPVQFRIIAAPEIPAAPAGPMRRLFNTIVLGVGIVAGCGLVILMSQIEGHVKTAADLAEFPDCNFLGSVSPAILIEATKRSLVSLHGRFGAAAAGLLLVFAAFTYLAPNLSTMPQRAALLLS